MIRIGIDVDNVMADFTEGFVTFFNERTGKGLKGEELLLWNFKDAINEMYEGEIDGDIANEILWDKRLAVSLKLREGVNEIFHKVCNHNEVEVVIVTALATELIPGRDKWFKNHFDGLNFEVHYETDKEKIAMDYLIDDGVHNLDKLSNKISKDNCICIKHPYNVDCKYKSFNTLEEAIYHILEKENISLKEAVI